jgi:hypothetical protein
LRQAEQRLHERETVDRAKAILIKQRHMTEPVAYRWLRSRAMASGRRIFDIAQELVAGRLVALGDRASMPGNAISRDDNDNANEAREGGAS